MRKRFIRCLSSPGYKIVFYVVMVGLMMGCSQGPISSEQAEELRSEIKEMQNQLAKVQSDLDDVIKSVENSKIRAQVRDTRDVLASMATSLSDAEEKLKPEEPPASPAQTPRAPGAVRPGQGFQ